MQKTIKDYVLSCHVYQKVKHETKLLNELLHPLYVPSQIWETICMDFITGLPQAQGQFVVMVVIDKLTKFDHFISM